MLRLHHLALKAKDPEALARFYSSLIGLSEQRRHHDDSGLRSVWLALGEAILMVERSSAGDPSPFSEDPPGLHLLAFAIAPDTAPAWRKKLPIQRETDFTLYFADPEGNRVALSSWPEPLAK